MWTRRVQTQAQTLPYCGGLEQVASFLCASGPSSASPSLGCCEDQIKHHLVSSRHSTSGPFCPVPPLGGSLALWSAVSLRSSRSHLGEIPGCGPQEARERLANAHPDPAPPICGPPVPHARPVSLRWVHFHGRNQRTALAFDSGRCEDTVAATPSILIWRSSLRVPQTEQKPPV